MLDSRLPKPDLVVYLQARLDVLLARLRKRAKDYERLVTPEYLQRIAEAYRDFFFHYEETPLLVVNCSEIDFVAHSEHTIDLIREICEMGQGVQHYIPLGSK
jgi:deoxyadenosine/deoxycytidine kinase